ncbi:hypothetical protein IWQ60_000208 [Tieghemiomyces parasiticus]|uniref:F-box domain-containing protein n=1 Tax=Tieghemiomyces parasiticus TaxID=78921 RepID=A0A9W8AGY4_9FUNG|nr:hypothetical protein IWQ60_000208 [Tieghemiomyces parasiticus]
MRYVYTVTAAIATATLCLHTPVTANIPQYNTAPATGLQRLPAELVSLISGYLDSRDKDYFSATSWGIRQATQSSRALWNARTAEDFARKYATWYPAPLPQEIKGQKLNVHGQLNPFPVITSPEAPGADLARADAGTDGDYSDDEDSEAEEDNGVGIPYPALQAGIKPLDINNVADVWLTLARTELVSYILDATWRHWPDDKAEGQTPASMDTFQTFTRENIGNPFLAMDKFQLLDLDALHENQLALNYPLVAAAKYLPTATLQTLFCMFFDEYVTSAIYKHLLSDQSDLAPDLRRLMKTFHPLFSPGIPEPGLFNSLHQIQHVLKMAHRLNPIAGAAHTLLAGVTWRLYHAGRSDAVLDILNAVRPVLVGAHNLERASRFIYGHLNWVIMLAVRNQDHDGLKYFEQALRVSGLAEWIRRDRNLVDINGTKSEGVWQLLVRNWCSAGYDFLVSDLTGDRCHQSLTEQSTRGTDSRLFPDEYFPANVYLDNQGGFMQFVYAPTLIQVGQAGQPRR